jgi:hypothetical protein
MAFKNRVRLPLQLFRPQFLEERQAFRKSTGEVKTLSVMVRKVYLGETDLLPATVHEKIKIALSHDTVNVEGDAMLGEIVQEGDYQITWPEFLDYPIGKGAFTAEVKAFNAVNTNSANCEELLGLEAVADRYENAYGELIPLAEGGEYTIDVAANDEICCSPVDFSITSYNDEYVDSITIDTDGVVTFTLKTGLPDLGEVELFVYRVSCPNDNYDEAGVTVAIDGSVASCTPPSAVVATAVAPTEYDLEWTAPVGGTPVGGYEWQLFDATDLITPIDSGTWPDEGPLTLTGLTDNTDYVFKIRSVCDGPSTSSYIEYEFTTPPQSESCGRYEVEYNDGTGIPDNFTMISYIACDGSVQQIAAYNERHKFICALQVSAGDPVTITGATTIIYLSEC